MNDVAVKAKRTAKRGAPRGKLAVVAADGQIPIQLSAENVPDANVAVPKYFTFNETGNIMLSTTVKESNQISPSSMDMFEEVAVFFAAMTKALQDKSKDLYDYQALDDIVRGSRLFIQVDEETYNFKSQSAGATFNTELIAAVLGIAATDGAALVFAQKLLHTLGKEATIEASKSQGEDKVGHLLFVCEYLMGMPLVSALLFEIDSKMASAAFTAGPCVKGGGKTQEIRFQKSTYMFVPPKILRLYSGDLVSTDSDQSYSKLVQELAGYIKK